MANFAVHVTLTSSDCDLNNEFAGAPNQWEALTPFLEDGELEINRRPSSGVTILDGDTNRNAPRP
jgi:hypothetical protein